MMAVLGSSNFLVYMFNVACYARPSMLLDLFNTKLSPVGVVCAQGLNSQVESS